MKVFAFTILLTLLPMGINASELIPIIGAWQSVEDREFFENSPKLKLWKKYRSDGKVEVIYGNGGEIKWNYITNYLIENGKLLEPSTSEGIQSVTNDQKEFIWSTSELKNNASVWNITFENEKLRLSSQDDEYWIIFERRQTPDSDLINLPNINKYYHEQLKVFNELIPDRNIVKYKDLLDFLTDMGIDHFEDQHFIIGTIYDRYQQKVPTELNKLIEFIKNAKKLMPPPKKLRDPIAGGEIQLLDMHIDISRHKIIHIGKNINTGKYWYYEKDKGWYQPTEKQLRNVKKNK